MLSKAPSNLISDMEVTDHKSMINTMADNIENEI